MGHGVSEYQLQVGARIKKNSKRLEKGQGNCNPVRNVGIKKTRLLVLSERSKLDSNLIRNDPEKSEFTMIRSGCQWT